MHLDCLLFDLKVLLLGTKTGWSIVVFKVFVLFVILSGRTLINVIFKNHRKWV